MSIPEPSQPAKQLRLFVALETPEDLKARLRALQAELRDRLRGSEISWTKPEQIHLTLRFLGGVSDVSVPELAESLRANLAGMRSFQVRAKGIGCFPGPRRPRVIWVGLSGDLQEMESVQKAVAHACGSFTDEAEEKEFRPHLTIARVKALGPGDGAVLVESCDRWAEEAFGAWTVREVLLYRSVLGAGGAKHTVLASFPL